jgi:tRNA U34 5-carboxymethylaminomethyl modifying enzyme MnmG/GidA
MSLAFACSPRKKAPCGQSAKVSQWQYQELLREDLELSPPLTLSEEKVESLAVSTSEADFFAAITQEEQSMGLFSEISHGNENT